MKPRFDRDYESADLPEDGPFTPTAASWLIAARERLRTRSNALFDSGDDLNGEIAELGAQFIDGLADAVAPKP